MRLGSIHHLRIISPGREIARGSLHFTPDGRLAAVSPSDQGVSGPGAFDGSGLTAMPGFIDIHSHGANGCDLSHATEDAVRTIAEAKLREGVTTWLPTTWTESPAALQAMAGAVASYHQRSTHARADFLHVEGPYLNRTQAGAQNPEEMRPPDVDEILGLHGIHPVRLVSVAPELPGALDFIRAMAGHGIVTSAAHTAATIEEYRAGRAAGLTHLTHYCNQMSPLHHRAVGMVGAALLDDEVMIEAICDTVHLSRDMVALLFKHRSTDRIMLITDSMAASHLGDGEYPMGGIHITVQGGIARIAAGNLAGSTLLFQDGLRHVAEISGLPLTELVKTTASNQARSLGFTDRGNLAEGEWADVVLLDDDFNVRATVVGGEMRYQA